MYNQQNLCPENNKLRCYAVSAGCILTNIPHHPPENHTKTRHKWRNQENMPPNTKLQLILYFYLVWQISKMSLSCPLLFLSFFIFTSWNTNTINVLKKVEDWPASYSRRKLTAGRTGTMETNWQHETADLRTISAQIKKNNCTKKLVYLCMWASCILSTNPLAKFQVKNRLAGTDQRE